MRAGEFPNGARVLRAKIDMASPEHQPARPRAVPDRARDPPAHGRRLVHLPDVRLRARPVGRDRGRDPLDLHARVRGPPAALRLADRAPAGPVTSPTSTSSRGSTSPTPCCRSGVLLRARAARATSAAGTTRGCRRSRASAGAASRPRGSATSRPRSGVAKADSVHRGRAARARGPRRAQPDGAAPVRRPRPDQGRHRELPRRPRRDDGGRQQPRGPVGRHARGAVRARAVDRARRLHGGAAAQVLPPLARAARSACGTRTSSPARTSSRTPTAGSSSSAAPTTRRPAAATRPTAGRPKATLHWVSARARRPGRGPPVRPPVHEPRPGRRPRPVRGPQPGVRDDRHRSDGRALARRRSPSARPSSSSGSATSRRTRTRAPDALVFNRTLTLKDTWAKVQAKG